MNVSAEITSRRRQRRLGGSEVVTPTGMRTLTIDRWRVSGRIGLADVERDVVGAARGTQSNAGNGDAP